MNIRSASDLCKTGSYRLVPEVSHGLGTYRVKLVVNGNAYAHLTFAHAKCSRKLNAVAYAVLLDEVLELLNYLTRAFDMT